MNWDNFGKFIGVQGILALALTVALIVLMFLGRPIPAEAWGLLGVSWGFYFAKNGTKVATTIQSKIQKG